jgi:hypothetical protein
MATAIVIGMLVVGPNSQAHQPAPKSCHSMVMVAYRC